MHVCEARQEKAMKSAPGVPHSRADVELAVASAYVPGCLDAFLEDAVGRISILC